MYEYPSFNWISMGFEGKLKELICFRVTEYGAKLLVVEKIEEGLVFQ